MFGSVMETAPHCTVTDPDGKKPIPLIVIASPPCGEPEDGMLLMNSFRRVSSWRKFEGSTGAAAPRVLGIRRSAPRRGVRAVGKAGRMSLPRCREATG